MTRVDRRAMLKGSVVLGAAAAVPLGTARAEARLVVYDSRIPESLDFARAQPGGHLLDLAHAHQTQWAELRGHLPEVGMVEGLTGWSDWIAVRGELEARGLRLAAEDRIAAPLSSRTHLFRWSMKGR